MKHYTAFLVATGAIAATVPTAVCAQVSSTNYRQYAACAEVLVKGRWFNTFGEGHCPPGSNRISQYQGDVNSQNMRRTQNAVQAIGQMQQSLLALGQAIGDRYQAASDQRAATYVYHLVEPGPPAESLYTTRKVIFPMRGTVVYAGLGDPVATISDGFSSSCFIALDDGEASQIGGHHHHVRAGELVCKLKEKDGGYTPLYNNYS